MNGAVGGGDGSSENGGNGGKVYDSGGGEEGITKIILDFLLSLFEKRFVCIKLLMIVAPLSYISDFIFIS